MTDLMGVPLYIDPDGIIGHMPDCPHRITGGTFETGPPKFAASCCIEVAPGPDPRFRTFEPPPRTFGSGAPLQHDEPEDEWTVEAMETWLADLGRKCEPDDMTPGIIEAVETWLHAYSGDFEFLLDVRSKKGARALSAGQAKGVANCWRADIFRRPSATVAPEPSAPGLDVSTIPSGKYAVPGGDTRLKVKVDNVDRGNWAGWVFVKDAAEYGAGEKYGSQKPGGTYRGKIEDVLRIIAADPKAASIAYGKLTGSCGRCGRHLEDEESIANGIGPVCAQKGW